MGGRRRLRAVPQRVFPDHRGPDGVALRRFYAALAADLPLDTPLLRLEASRVSTLGVLALNATRALTAAQQARATGKGRRPSPREIERLARRQGLADTSYSQALAALRELATTTRARVPASPAELLKEIGHGR